CLTPVTGQPLLSLIVLQETIVFSRTLLLVAPAGCLNYYLQRHQHVDLFRPS
ncbi:unnamed protein product, partial [Brassica oleracea var. botrytis]